MDKRFLPEINAIKEKIVAFNQYLNPKYKLPVFDFDRMIEQKQCIKIVHGNYKAFGFPNSAKRGVYFIFGHEKTNEAKNGLYIGKASFRSAIGKRLYTRFTHNRESGFFEMNGYHNERYVLDYMASIDLDSLNMAFLATALEEYLISELKKSLNLLNGTGN